MSTVASFERQIFFGDAGTTAATQITTHTEINLNKTSEYSPTTPRGDGSKIPIATEQPVTRTCALSFKLLNRKTGPGATHRAFLVGIAIHESSPMCAIKIVDHPSGSVQFNGDCFLEVNDPDDRILEFTCHPTDKAGRDPIF